MNKDEEKWWEERKIRRERQITELRKQKEDFERNMSTKLNDEIETLIGIEKQLSKQKGMLKMLRRCYRHTKKNSPKNI